MDLNVLQEWEQAHFIKILAELEAAEIELTVENIPEMIVHTSFVVRSKRVPDDCPYYPTGESCHLQVKDLSCFLCACPEYDSTTEIGGCRSNGGRGSPRGKWAYHKNLPKGKVWDCSDCSNYHSTKQVASFLKDHMGSLKSLGKGSQ